MKCSANFEMCKVIAKSYVCDQKFRFTCCTSFTTENDQEWLRLMIEWQKLKEFNSVKSKKSKTNYEYSETGAESRLTSTSLCKCLPLMISPNPACCLPVVCWSVWHIRRQGEKFVLFCCGFLLVLNWLGLDDFSLSNTYYLQSYEHKWSTQKNYGKPKITSPETNLT